MNSASSRSHAVFTLYVSSTSRDELSGVAVERSARLHVIDLAGSERQKSAGTSGQALKEGAAINKSLAALGNVIRGLLDVAEGRARFVPYRDSKLTLLLRDSLGGNSKTRIVANISPAAKHCAETLSTLKFAQRAKRVTNRAVVNQHATGKARVGCGCVVFVIHRLPYARKYC